MESENINEIPEIKQQTQYLKSINQNDDSLSSKKEDDALLFEKEYTAYLEKQFKKSLYVQLQIGKIFIGICLCISLVMWDILQLQRVIRISILMAIIYYLYQKNHKSPFQLNSSVVFIYSLQQLTYFEVVFKKQKENQIYIMIMMHLFQQFYLQFIYSSTFNRLLIVFFTYIYYFISYYLSFGDSTYLQIDQEKVIQPIFLLIFRFLILSFDEHFKEYMKEKYFEARESEKQWLKSLDSIPQGVVIYNIQEKQIVFQNKMVAMIINSNSLQNHIQEEVKQTNNLNNTLIEKELSEEQKQLQIKSQQDISNQSSSKSESLISIAQLIQQQIETIQMLNKKDREEIINDMDQNNESQRNKEIEEFQKDMEGSTYKIQDSGKKLNIQCSVFLGKNAKFGLISMADVTNVQKFEKQRVADQFKTMYLQSLAHDLRTPLNTIITMCEYCLNYYKKDKMIQSCMKICIYQCQYLILILDQVQDLSKYQMGMFSLENASFNLRDKFEYWIENIVIQSELKQLQFNYDFDQSIPLTIVSDAQKIQNIILNLIGNSIKYSTQGFIKIKISNFQDDEAIINNQINSQNDKIDRQIKFEVEDTGCGIPLEKQENIFQLFGQQQKSGSYENTGVGLGLAYCKMVVEQMNGEIKCISQPDKGTLISFYITVKCQRNDRGLTQDEHNNFLSILKDKVTQSQMLMHNLYMVDEEEPQNKEEKDKIIVEIKQKKSIINQEYLKENEIKNKATNDQLQENDYLEECNIYTQIDTKQINDQKIIEYVNWIQGCTKDLNLKTPTRKFQSNLQDFKNIIQHKN